MERPFIWQMIKEAVENLGGKATYPEIKKYISNKWDNVNEATINAQLIVLSVNQPSRVLYPENKKPRVSNWRYDVLYSIGRGQVVTYDPQEHGLWEIYQNEVGALAIRQIINEGGGDDDLPEQETSSVTFPIEAHLRDFLINNLHTVKGSKLKLYVDETGRDGKEFQTEVGNIDILATDEKGNFIVFELKLSRGADKALGQLLRYMGWIKKNLAKDKDVKGVIVASKMDNKIKYAVTVTPDVTLYEYAMKFELAQPKE